MKIAVVSTDGINVNEHFGKADRFLIYDSSDKGLTFIEEMQVQRLSENDPKHQFNEETFRKISEALAGCQKVFVTKIGDKPKEELTKSGIEPVIYEGPIDGITT